MVGQRTDSPAIGLFEHYRSGTGSPLFLCQQAQANGKTGFIGLSTCSLKKRRQTAAALRT